MFGSAIAYWTFAEIGDGEPLPNAERAELHPSKFLEYLLSFESERGQHKARSYRRAGYTLANWQELSQRIYDAIQTTPAMYIRHNEYGDRYTCIVTIPKANMTGTVDVMTVWNVDVGRDHPRLITAYIVA